MKRQRPRDLIIEAARTAAARKAVDAEIIAAIDKALAMIPEVDMRDAIESLLLPVEHKAIQLSAELFNAVVAITGDGPTREADLAELAHDVHHLQTRILAQAAGRAFPHSYRLLGSTIPQHD